MSVDIGPYTQIPNKLFGSGTAAILGPSATLLWVALCEHANRNSENTFSVSDKSLASDTTLSPRTICDARKVLRERGFLKAERQKGTSYSYTLLPCKLGWVPVKERLREKRKPRALHAKRSGAIANFATPETGGWGKFC